MNMQVRRVLMATAMAAGLLFLTACQHKSATRGATASSTGATAGAFSAGPPAGAAGGTAGGGTQKPTSAKRGAMANACGA